MVQVTRLGRSTRRFTRFTPFTRLTRFAPLLVAVGSVGAVVAASAVPAAAVPSLAPPPVRDEDRPTGAVHHLTVTVRNEGGRIGRTYEVDCHPSRGGHPDVDGACAAVDRNTRWGTDAFAPVPEGSMCSMQYGGPATAHVTGTWAGRPVDAAFDRTDGCEIGRWNRFVPLLPQMGSGSLNERP